jgi:hypothetical protein
MKIFADTGMVEGGTGGGGKPEWKGGMDAATTQCAILSRPGIRT